MSEGTCNVQVNRGDHRVSIFQACGRKIERDGKCKMHLRVEERRRERDEERKKEWDRSRALDTEAKILSEKLGVCVSAHYDSFSRRHTGDFIVEGDWLRSRASNGQEQDPSAGKASEDK